MTTKFTKSDIKKIEKTLGVTAKFKGNNFRFEISNPKEQRQMALEIYPNLMIGKKKGHLVSAYTHNTHFQLHFCSGFVTSSDIGEVTFLAESKDKVSAIVVEKEGASTFYANVDKKILSGDYRMLSLDVMLAGIALSLTVDSGAGKKKGS